MYLRRCYRVKDGKRHAYWALVKSVRTARGPRQEVVAYLGEEAGIAGVAGAADRARVGGYSLADKGAKEFNRILSYSCLCLYS